MKWIIIGVLVFIVLSFLGMYLDAKGLYKDSKWDGDGLFG